jgi:DNA polymerase III alpha subunit (gram-positive type)
MKKQNWVLIDTETTGFTNPIYVVEIGAQKMLGWKRDGPPFRRLLNQNLDIPPEAARVNGYTREILERDGYPAAAVYRDFAAYADGLPIVSYNLEYDLTSVLEPEWKRLDIAPIGAAGFCALRLAQRLLDPVPAGNCKLQTLRQYYRLPERGAHTALGDVETVVDLMANVLKPIAESRGISSWEDICAYVESEWFPSRIAFGKFKGRHFQDARTDKALIDWLAWLSGSTNERSASMGRWYLSRLELEETVGGGIAPAMVQPDGVPQTTSRQTFTATSVVVFVDLEVEQLQQLVASARSQLAEVETAYTKDRHAVDVTQAAIFKLMRAHYQARDRLRLVIDYRSKYLKILLHDGEDEAAEVAEEFENAEAQSNANYEEAAATANGRKRLSDDEENELKSLWKKLVRLYHPDRFADQPEKLATYTQLTSAINKAKGDGNIALLREIANDPHGFILRAGWIGLDFDDAVAVKNLRRLLDTLQLEIVSTLEMLNDLRESPEFELHTLSIKNPKLLDEVAEEQGRSIAAEIVEMEATAARLKAEIAELIGEDEPIIG